MALEKQDIYQRVKDWILKEFLPNENPDLLTESTTLISSGILDSISSLKLVSFLEEQFGVQFDARDVDAENLDNLELITRIVSEKLVKRG